MSFPRPRVPSTLAPARRQRPPAARAGEADLEAENEALRAAVDALSRERDRLEELFEFASAIAERTDVPGIAAAILDAVCDLAQAEFGLIHVRRDDRYDLAGTRGLRREHLPELAVEGAEDQGVALAERRWVSRPAPSGEQLCVPLLHRGRPLAVLTLLRARRPLTGDRRHSIERLLAQAGVALANGLAYEEARRQTLILKAVLDATNDPIRMVDRTGRLVVENRAACQLRLALDFPEGLSADELAGVAAPLVEDPEAFARTYRAIEQDERYSGIDEYRLVGTGRAFARFTAPVLGAGGEVVGRIFVLRDVTAERESERIKDEFVALVSHELRTPLTSIIGYVETLLDTELGPLTGEQEHFLRVVDRNAGRLHGLVGDLLFSANLDAGAVSLELQDLDLVRLVGECLEAARPQAESRGIELVFDAPAHLPPVCGDAHRLVQVIDNLLSNALKFTPGEGCVTVAAHASASTVSVEVSDTGIGIPVAEQAHLFDRFYRATGATARAIPGSGLGLSVAQAIVAAHGGAISVTSREGVGSTFRIELPRASEARAAA